MNDVLLEPLLRSPSLPEHVEALYRVLAIEHHRAADRIYANAVAGFEISARAFFDDATNLAELRRLLDQSKG